MDDQAVKAGKERVRVGLLVPLVDLLGLKRPRGMTQGQHLAGLAELQQRLAYLSAEEIAILRETVVEGLAKGGAWPAHAVVLALAHAIRRPPDTDTGRVVRYLRWAAGQPAIAPHHLTRLYLWLKQHRGVPGDYDWRQIRAEAEEDERWRARMLDLLDRGVALGSAEEGRLQRLNRARRRVVEITQSSDMAEAS